MNLKTLFIASLCAMIAGCAGPHITHSDRNSVTMMKVDTVGKKAMLQAANETCMLWDRSGANHIKVIEGSFIPMKPTLYIYDCHD